MRRTFSAAIILYDYLRLLFVVIFSNFFDSMGRFTLLLNIVLYYNDNIKQINPKMQPPKSRMTSVTWEFRPSEKY